MPNKERIRLLVDALRSGKYRQTTGNLAVYDEKQKRKKFCCLGVACEVARANGLALDVERMQRQDYRDQATYSFGDAHGASYSMLPPSVVQWYGFSDDDPDLIRADDEEDNYTYYETATHCNDSLGMSFRQIADAFEAMYLKDDDA